ncbi:hypothetical protein Dimus_016646 [Dionaea muscipula]
MSKKQIQRRDQNTLFQSGLGWAGLAWHGFCFSFPWAMTVVGEANGKLAMHPKIGGRIGHLDHEIAIPHNHGTQPGDYRANLPPLSTMNIRQEEKGVRLTASGELAIVLVESLCDIPLIGYLADLSRVSRGRSSLWDVGAGVRGGL